jgi:microsomal epoxide hydrolase
MVYVLTNTFNTAAWIYFGRREEGGRYFPNDFKKISIPTGIAMFPKEMSAWPPKSYIEKIFNIKQISIMNEGGHFPALEKPRLLIEDIRKFFRNL